LLHKATGGSGQAPNDEQRNGEKLPAYLMYLVRFDIAFGTFFDRGVDREGWLLFIPFIDVALSAARL